MNERVHRLKLQAGINDNPDQEGLDLFAQLIVEECAGFADEHNDFSEGVTLGVGRALKKHFGVELDVNETLRNRSTYFGNDI